MTRFLLFFILTFSCAGYAQNYQCLQSGTRSYFVNEYGYLRGIRIDSVKIFGDTTIFYPFHTPRGAYSTGAPSYLHPNGSSWLGGSVFQSHDGIFSFDNQWTDKTVIKTQAHLGDTWTFWSDTTPIFYSATLTGTDTMTISRTVDSVKKILITAHDATGIVSTDPMNNAEIKISKNHGFVQVFDLYTFPYHKPSESYTRGLDYYLDASIPDTLSVPIPNLSTMTFKLVDYILPTYKYLYQWNEGDVYEYSGCNFGWDPYVSNCSIPWMYELDTVQDTFFTPSSSNYTCTGLDARLVVTSGPPTITNYTITVDSNVLTYYNTSPIQIDKMPEEYGQLNIHYYIPNDTIQMCIPGPLYMYVNNHISDSVYYPAYYYYPYPYLDIHSGAYKHPIGLLFYNSTNYSVTPGGIEDYVNVRTLLYYNRHYTACGRYIDINGLPLKIMDPSPANNTLVYPNPASTMLTVSSAGRISSVTIYNLFGQITYTALCNSEKMQIDISSSPAGIYFVKVNGVMIEKFVKE